MSSRHDPIDDTPVAIPVRFKRRDALAERVQAEVLKLSMHMAQQGHETFEEANDFDCDDDRPDYSSDYEMSAAEELLYHQNLRRILEAEKSPPAAPSAPAPSASPPAPPEPIST